MKPQNLKTKIFLDGGDPNETREALKLLGFLDGQTTNPTLVSKNPEIQAHLASGKKFTEKEIYDRYRAIVTEISGLLPNGSVSIEVYADQSTPEKQMLEQGAEMFSWIPNAHIKYPIIPSGLGAAEQSIKAGRRVNMTLCFSEEQAAAVYAATQGAKKGEVFVSPFIGRLDDQGENGMTLIENILTMYKAGDSHVEVLVASVRNMDHFLRSLQLGADIITTPFKILKEWEAMGMPIPGSDFVYNAGALKPIPYQELDLTKNWSEYNIKHPLTDSGIDRFSKDWNALIQ